MKAQWLDAAKDDLNEAASYYESQRPGLGKEFKKAVRSALQRIKRFPNAWQPLSPNTRRFLMQRFPYGIVYHVVNKSQVVVVAVAHLHRKPGHWSDRI